MTLFLQHCRRRRQLSWKGARLSTLAIICHEGSPDLPVSSFSAAINLCPELTPCWAVDLLAEPAVSINMMTIGCCSAGVQKPLLWPACFTSGCVGNSKAPYLISLRLICTFSRHAFKLRTAILLVLMLRYWSRTWWWFVAFFQTLWSSLLNKNALTVRGAVFQRVVRCSEDPVCLGPLGNIVVVLRSSFLF